MPPMPMPMPMPLSPGPRARLGAGGAGCSGGAATWRLEVCAVLANTALCCTRAVSEDPDAPGVLCRGGPEPAGGPRSLGSSGSAESCRGAVPLAQQDGDQGAAAGRGRAGRGHALHAGLHAGDLRDALALHGRGGVRGHADGLAQGRDADLGGGRRPLRRVLQEGPGRPRVELGVPLVRDPHLQPRAHLEDAPGRPGHGGLVEGLVPAEGGDGKVVVHVVQGKVDGPHVGAPAVGGDKLLHHGQDARVLVLQVQHDPAERDLDVRGLWQLVKLAQGFQAVRRHRAWSGVDEVVQEEHDLLRLFALQVPGGHACRRGAVLRLRCRRQPLVRQAAAAVQEAAVDVRRRVVEGQLRAVEPVLPVHAGQVHALLPPEIHEVFLEVGDLDALARVLLEVGREPLGHRGLAPDHLLQVVKEEVALLVGHPRERLVGVDAVELWLQHGEAL
mmetsp:Transcript_98635/g.307808  ORF Transcript_98635/g.307808 Transcript_98635/m.307808 type:complete len:444 (-) Transcript_98635:1133-2464(-)